jgi:hypothetical protein
MLVVHADGVAFNAHGVIEVYAKAKDFIKDNQHLYIEYSKVDRDIMLADAYENCKIAIENEATPNE